MQDIDSHRKKVLPVIKVGQKVRFDPLSFVSGYGAELVKGNKVTGTVFMVNQAHKLFFVKYGDNMRTSFKFCEIGQNVHICK